MYRKVVVCVWECLQGDAWPAGVRRRWEGVNFACADIRDVYKNSTCNGSSKGSDRAKYVREVDIFGNQERHKKTEDFALCVWRLNEYLGEAAKILE